MGNYFNTLSLGQKLDQLSKCRFMDTSEFDTGVDALKNK
jgi:ketol-acid reductoisomerase